METSGGSTSHSLGWLFGRKSGQSKSQEQQQRSRELRPHKCWGRCAESEFLHSCWLESGKAAAENSMRALHRVKQSYSGPAVTRMDMYLKELKAEACVNICIPISMVISTGPSRQSIASMHSGWVKR